MQFINTLTNYLILIMAVVVVVGGIVGVIIYYFLKIRKVASLEENVDYSSFNRVDATDYIKFKDIISTGRPGDPSAIGIIDLGEHRFVAGISVQGYNYAGASVEERKRTMINAIAFFNMLNEPIQMRQTSQAVDIRRNIDEVKKDEKRIESEYIEADEEYKMSVPLLDNEDILNNSAAFKALTDRLDILMNKMHSLEWQLNEAKELESYMTNVSSTESNMKKVNQVMFSYTYNPDEQTEELSEEEIYLKAQRELYTKAQTLGGALEGCGCSWRVLTADDLTDLLRRHLHPVTADTIKLEDILNSSYSALYIASTDLEEIVREKIGNLRFEEEQRRYAIEIRKQQEKAEEDLRAARELAQSAAHTYEVKAAKEAS